jgi:hypothetical protein
VAKIIGKSGAWRAIVNDLTQMGQSVSGPQDLEPLLVDLQNNRPELIEAHHEKTMYSVLELETEIERKTGEQGFFRRLVNWFEIRSLKAEVAGLYQADTDYSSTLDSVVVRLQSLINSAELSGAKAELSVVQQLRSLPPSVVVFNDVRLRATRHIHYEGASLQSAQIDHVVLAPAGIFIVETKYWSSRFIESGNFFNPFQQTSRANYLCYDLLREKFGKIRVRNIIVCFGSLLVAPPNSYTKVVRPENLTSYIAGFRNTELTPSLFEDLCRFFESRIGPQEYFQAMPRFNYSRRRYFIPYSFRYLRYLR